MDVNCGKALGDHLWKAALRSSCSIEMILSACTAAGFTQLTKVQGRQELIARVAKMRLSELLSVSTEVQFSFLWKASLPSWCLLLFDRKEEIVVMWVFTQSLQEGRVEGECWEQSHFSANSWSSFFPKSKHCYVLKITEVERCLGNSIMSKTSET